MSSDIRSFGAYALTNEFEYIDEGIPFLRGTNYNGSFINFDDVYRISPNAHKLLHKSAVEPGMVLLSMSGSVGSVSVALDTWNYPINSNQDIAKIVPASIDPFFLAAFLSCSFGQAHLDRSPVGSVQQHVFLWMIEKFKIPRFTPPFEQLISDLARQGYEMNETVTDHFRRAEEILFEALQLDNWTPPDPLSFVARASDIGLAKRADAQYFRPIFSAVEDRLKLRGGSAQLGDVTTLLARGRQPIYTEQGTPVINSKHVRTNHVAWINNRSGISDLNSLLIRKGDVVLNGTGVGTIGRAAPYLSDEPALPDNHVTIIRTSHFDPVYLAAFLNSSLGQSQIERHIKGSSGQIELYPDDIAKIFIWDAPQEVQLSIRSEIFSAFGREQKAQEFLANARRGIETAIIQSEDIALAYINNLYEKEK